jgi:RNA polymerase sigma-70 factor (ECF subfamily)
VANHRRRQRWRFWRTGEDRKLASLPSPVRDPHAELERQQAAHLFYRTLDQLPEKYRTVLVLFEIEGLSTHDIAELCHLPWSTVKVQLHRARERFLRHHELLTRKGKS